MRNRQLISVVLLCLAVIMGGCRYNRCIGCEETDKARAEAQKARRQKIKARKLAIVKRKKLKLIREQLKLTPLFEKWHHSLDEENIRQLYVCDGTLIVETTSNKIFSFNRETGIPNWIYTIGDPLDFKAVAYKDKVYLLSMAKLHILDKKTGKLLIKKELSFVPSSPLCLADRYVYIGAWDNFIYALNNDTAERDWRYRIDGLIWGNSAASDGVLFFPGTDERLYAINANSGTTIQDWGKHGRFASRGPNISDVLVQITPPRIYFGSRDYNFYCVSRITGTLIWKYESGGEIKETPYRVGSSLYVLSNRSLNDRILYVLDSETGDMKWSVDHGICLFFIGKYHDWVIKNDHRVAAVKSNEGKIRNHFNLNLFDLFVTNTEDNTGYMATRDGFVFAVEER